MGVHGRCAAWATAYPILPLDRLLTKRTGSMGSRVGPAVTSTFTASALPDRFRHGAHEDVEIAQPPLAHVAARQVPINTGRVVVASSCFNKSVPSP